MFHVKQMQYVPSMFHVKPIGMYTSNNYQVYH